MGVNRLNPVQKATYFFSECYHILEQFDETFFLVVPSPEGTHILCLLSLPTHLHSPQWK